VKERPRKSISVDGLTGYIEDLIRMEFVTKYTGKDGAVLYKLTDLGKKAGIAENFKKQ